MPSNRNRNRKNKAKIVVVSDSDSGSEQETVAKVEAELQNRSDSDSESEVIKKAVDTVQHIAKRKAINNIQIDESDSDSSDTESESDIDSEDIEVDSDSDSDEKELTFDEAYEMAPPIVKRFLTTTKFKKIGLKYQDAFMILISLCMYGDNPKIVDPIAKLNWVLDKHKQPHINLQSMAAIIVNACGLDSDSSLLEALIEHKNSDIDINHVYDLQGGNSLLMEACAESHGKSSPAAVELILKHKADVNQKNAKGQTALMMASVFAGDTSDPSIVKLLIDHGAKVDDADNSGNTALISSTIFSANGSDIEAIKLLLDNGADINKKGVNEHSALAAGILHYGLSSNFAVIKLLVERGADVNIRDKSGSTPLILACEACIFFRCRSVEMAELLLKHGADINAQDDTGNTCTMGMLRTMNISAEEGDIIDTELAKLLLKQEGIDLTLKNKEGKTAYDLATSSEPVKRLFRKHMNKNNTEQPRLINNGKNNLLCPECKVNNRDVVLIKCHHSFCSDCVDEALKGKKECWKCECKFDTENVSSFII